MPYIIHCLFLFSTMISVSSQEKPLLQHLSLWKDPQRGEKKKGILFGDDANPSHTWKCIPPHRTVAMRVPNPAFLSSDAWAHRKCTDLPICVSENIVECKRPYPHCCLNWNNNPQWSNLLVLCRKNVFSLASFTSGKCSFIAMHRSSKVISQHGAGNYCYYYNV